jgi:SAM-dependent methyltransferase
MPEDMDQTTRDHDNAPPEIDTTKAHSARVYDYLLGGKDNYPPDREAAEQLIKIVPSVPVTVRQNSLFMQRLARYLAAEEGIDQFLDIGTGIPTSPNLHQIAQRANPAARVVFVDNDPIVLAHARARLTSGPLGRVEYIHADLRDALSVLTAPDLMATLDLSRPVGLFILSTLHLITDADEARELLGRYVDALAPGSFVAVSVSTNEGFTPQAANAAISVLSTRGIPVMQRTHAEVTAIFDGLELIEPGVVRVNKWRPDADTPEAHLSEIGLYCGVARKP